MTVLDVNPMSFDDSDLAKSLGLLDGCDTFPWAGTQDFLGEDLLSFDGDLLSMPSLPVPQMNEFEACVSPMVPAQNWPPEPLVDDHRNQSLSPASSDSWHPTGDSANSSESASVAVATSGSAKKDPRIGKRKPEPQLDAIADVQERRKQRRLAKNRATAAVSRERKRAQMATMGTRVEQLEAENANLTSLLSTRDAELAALRRQLAAVGSAR